VSRWLSGAEDLLHTHRMRAIADAVLVGANTVLHDDPQLTVRLCAGTSPVRVIVDPERRLDGSQRVFHDTTAPTLVLVAANLAHPGEAQGEAEVVPVPRGEGGLDLGPERRLIGLDREQPVGALIHDRAGDTGIGGDGIDGHQRVLQPALGAEPVEQRRDGGKLAGLVGHRLGGQNQPGGGGENRDQMQRSGPGPAIMAAARGLAVDGDELVLVNYVPRGDSLLVQRLANELLLKIGKAEVRVTKKVKRNFFGFATHHEGG